MFRRIEICGGIASGKTTLTQLLKNSGMPTYFEDFRSNPFWKLFYEDPLAFAFETEITFLLQHYSLVKTVDPGPKPAVFDFSFVLDHAYADINLKGSEMDAFRNVASVAESQIGIPHFLIHLECTPKDELERIRDRNRSEETSLDVGYLTKLNEAVNQRVDALKGSCEVLTINSSEIDFAHDEISRSKIAARILSMIDH